MSTTLHYHFTRIFSLFVLIVFCLVNSSSGQHDKINMTTVNEKGISAFAVSRVIGFDASHYLIHAIRKDAESLMQFDLQHQLQFQIPIPDLAVANKISFRDMITTKAGTMLYFFDDDKTNDQWKIYSGVLSNRTLSPVKEVMSIEFSRKMESASRLTAPYEHTISRDSTRVAIYRQLGPNVIGLKSVIGVALLNENMEPLWNRSLTIESDELDTEVRQLTVSNKGEIYLVIKVKLKVGAAKEDKSVLVRFTETGAEMIPFTLEAENLSHEMRLYLFENEAEDVLIAGLYTNGKDEALKGMFISRGKMDVLMLSAKEHPFPDSLVAKISSEKTAKKKKGFVYDFKVDQVVPLKNGGFAFVAEQRYLSTNFTPSGDSYSFHCSDDIIMPIFNQAGELMAVPLIDKTFCNRDGNTDSYVFSFNGHHARFAYVDYKEPQELDIKGLKEAGLNPNSYFDLTVMDDHGDIMVQKNIFSAKEKEILFRPMLSAFSDTHVLIGNMSPDNVDFGIIPLK